MSLDAEVSFIKLKVQYLYNHILPRSFIFRYLLHANTLCFQSIENLKTKGNTEYKNQEFVKSVGFYTAALTKRLVKIWAFVYLNYTPWMLFTSSCSSPFKLHTFLYLLVCQLMNSSLLSSSERNGDIECF